MAASEPIRRSGRNKRTLVVVDSVPPLVQGPAQLPATAGKTEHTKISQYDTPPLDEPKAPSTKQETFSTKQPPKFRYFCPISDCKFSRSLARGIKEHYNTEHQDLKGKEMWSSKLAKTMPYNEWLASEKKLATSTGLKKRGRPIRQFVTSQESPKDQISLTTCTPNEADTASTTGPEDIPMQSCDFADGISVATATSAASRGSLSGPPPPKRRKLDDLLEKQKDQLRLFIEQELRVVKERPDSAEAKLVRLTAEREVELARDKERMQKMEEKLTKMEKQIQEEKDFGSSTRLKNDYLHQAKVAAKLNPSRPEHGGFVY
jgi:hypothetical protein